MDYKLGLRRGTVVLKKHQKEWVKAFKVEKNILKILLGDRMVDIQHIGSTSIPGLAAKPILDMIMAVQSLDQFTEEQYLLEKNGYEYRENGSNEKQILFVKGPEEHRTHYLHITEINSSVWKNDLAFRDYLISHPDTAKKYEELKIKLALKFTNDREKYTKGKNTFIRGVLDLIKP